MKKIFLSVLVAASFLTSCSDAYDIQQAGVVTQENQVFKNSADIGKGIRYIYALIPAETEIDFDSYFTDELGVGIGNAGQGINDGSYTFVLLAGNGNAQAIWGSYYGMVNRINRIINRIDELIIEKANDSNELSALKSHKAHALSLRAYAHYKLFAFFTPDYTNPDGLSIIKFDFLHTDDYSRFEKRSTVKEIVAFIENDIKAAKDLGGIVQSDLGTGSGYSSNEMMDAILIKMYSMLQTSESYSKLEDVFNNLATSSKSIATASTYLSMFGESADIADGSEGIFKLNRIVTDGSDQSGVASAWYPATVGENGYMEMGRSLYNELDKLDPSKTNQSATAERNDVRYLTAVHSNSKVAANYSSLSADRYRTEDVLNIGKYPGILPNRPLMNSIWLFRYTDMLLSLAEKRAFEGKLTGNHTIDDLTSVESIIYNIRVNRNLLEDGTTVSMPTNFSSQKEAFARILEERRVEFAFEGQRYLDMKRLGVRAGSPGFVRDPKDCESTNACRLEPNSTKLTLPIPRSEMVSNPNMVQNPGY